VQYDDFRLVRAGPQRPPRRRDRDARPCDVARVLAEPLTAGEANVLRAQLPGALQGDLIPTEPEAQPSAPDGFADRVARMGRLPEKEARSGMSPCSRRPAMRSSRVRSTTCLPNWAGSSPGSCPDPVRSDGGVPDTKGTTAHASRPASFRSPTA
jgi:hypothetical protein